MNISKLKNIVRVMLIISILTLIGMIAYDYYDMKKSDKYAEDMISEINKLIDDNQEVFIIDKNENTNNIDNTQNKTIQKQASTAKIKGYEVYGKIKIDKIGIEYPIIEYKNADALWKSICKISKNDVDGTGNLCLAGHNMRNLSMFGNLKKVDVGDKIKITNLYGEEFTYEVFEKVYIDPSQTEVLKNTDESIVTLITCNDASTKRLIVKGKLS